MIVGWQDGLDVTLRQTNPQKYAASLVDVYRQTDSTTEFVEHTGAVLASNLYRDEYPRSVPHSLLAFVAAVQLGRYVQPIHHFRALAQALWFYSQESALDLRVFREEESGAARIEEREGKEPELEELRQSRDFYGFLSRTTSDLREPVEREGMLGWLLREAGGDQFNYGHKHLYLSKSAALSEFLRWRNVETCFYPSVHYFLMAPSDRSPQEQIRSRLEHHHFSLQDRHFDKYDLSVEQIYQIRDSIVEDSPEGVLDTLMGALEYGVEPRTLSEALLATAAQLVLTLPHEHWYAAVHAFDFTESVFSTSEYHTTEDRLWLMLLNGLFLKRIVEETRLSKIREPFFASRPQSARTAPYELEEAIDQSIAQDAMASFDWLYRQGQLRGQIFEDLALVAIKSDAEKYSGHELKFAYAAIDAFHCSTSPLREYYVLALVKFLAECKKNRQMDHALAHALRNY